MKSIWENNLKTEKYNYCSILQSYCYMMQTHHLDVQIFSAIYSGAASPRHTGQDAAAVLSNAHHWWDSSHYTLIYVQVTALQIIRDQGASREQVVI